MSRSSAAAIPYCATVIGFNDWLAMGLQSLLKLNFHSCFFRVTSNLSKTATVGASLTSAGYQFHRLATRSVKKFCLSPFSALCRYNFKLWPHVERLVELCCCWGIM